MLNDAAVLYFADATLASAFVAQWCVGSKVETAACSKCARMSRRHRFEQGCTGRHEPIPATGVAIFENVFGVMIIGTEIGGLPP